MAAWAIASSFAVVNNRFVMLELTKTPFFMAIIPTFTAQNAFMRLSCPFVNHYH